MISPFYLKLSNYYSTCFKLCLKNICLMEKQIHLSHHTGGGWVSQTMTGEAKIVWHNKWTAPYAYLQKQEIVALTPHILHCCSVKALIREGLKKQHFPQLVCVFGGGVSNWPKILEFFTKRLSPPLNEKKSSTQRQETNSVWWGSRWNETNFWIQDQEFRLIKI